MKKTAFLCAGCFALLAVLLVVLVLCVDVAPIGPMDTSIGLSTINQAFHDMTGVGMAWYNVTEWIGYAAIAVAALFAVLGLVQLIQRKSLLKVDREILALGGLYAVTVLLYVLFEKVIVNYRPVIMPGEVYPEASFPSSHTMLTCAVMGSAMMVMGKYVRNTSLRAVLRGVCGAVIVVMVVGRLLSGVHWFTDILGGVLISGALLSAFRGFTANSD